VCREHGDEWFILIPYFPIWENNIEMDLKEVVGLWASLYPPKIQWWAFMDMIMNLHI
jgi:hypothetical protein